MRSSNFDPVSVEIFNNRFRKVTILVILAFAALFLRLWFLQLVKGPEYRVQSENNRIHLRDIPSFRGMIFDRNGELLVDNRPSYDMYIIPEEIQDAEGLLNSLRIMTGLDPDSVRKKLDRASRMYPFKPILLKKNITRNELAVLESNLFNLTGVMIQVRPQRHYIFNRFASHVIGYLGEINEGQLRSGQYPHNRRGDFIGKYGVEKKWQRLLNGLRGGEQVEVDAAGRRLRVISRKSPLPGLNICLTIDRKLQLLAEKEMEDKRGAIVAMNPTTGEILAMVSSPSFDPNLFIGGIERSEWERINSSTDYPLQNRAIAGQYPPGSVFKIVVALAGLEEGLVDPEEEAFCNGSYTVGTHTYHCWRKHGHGYVNLHQALVQSCDVYFYRLGRRLGVDKIARYAKMCGLGRIPNFDIGSEKPGLIPTSQWKLERWGVPWQAGETVSTAIGQSFVLVTPLQMAVMISSVFNGGHLVQPKVIKWVGKDDKMAYEFTPTVMRKLSIKSEHLDMVRDALTGVVNEPRGTGSRARLKDLLVAGKTGTAQVITLEKEKVLDKENDIPLEFRDHAWFVSIAPRDDPKLALAVLVEHGGHGGSAAAPIAKAMFQAYLGGKKSP